MAATLKQATSTLVDANHRAREKTMILQPENEKMPLPIPRETVRDRISTLPTLHDTPRQLIVQPLVAIRQEVQESISLALQRGDRYVRVAAQSKMRGVDPSRPSFPEL